MRGGLASSRGGFNQMPSLNRRFSFPQQSLGFGDNAVGGPNEEARDLPSVRGGRHSSGGVGLGNARMSGGVGQMDNQDHVAVIPVATHRLREFKIHGKIGEPPEEGKSVKDNDSCISYSNVMFQIRDGVAAGYTEREIVAAVVRAVTDPSLRDFLVENIMAENLKVDELKKVLGTHFKVKDATSLYNQMIKKKQGPEESVMKFVQEMMKLRTQIYRLSQTEGGNYSQKLLQTEFLRAVYNGLRQSDVRQSLRLTLKREDISDYELREEISELMLNEADHESKFEEAEKTKSVSVKQVDLAGKSKKEKDDHIMVHVIQKLDNFKSDVNKDLRDFKNDMLSQFAPPVNPNLQQQPVNINQPLQQQPQVNCDGSAGMFAGGYNFLQYPPFYSYPVGPAGYGGAGSGYGGGFNNLVDGQKSPFAGAFGAGRGRGGINNNNNNNNNNISSRGGRGGGRSGQNRGHRGGRGGGRGSGGPTGKKSSMCEICIAANARFCNHCLVCGNMDHMSYVCPHKDEEKN